MKSRILLLAAVVALESLAATFPTLGSIRVSAAVTADSAGRVYVIGGAAGAERWDPKDRRWSPIAAPSSTRVGAGAGWINDRLVLVGGGGGSGGLAYATVPEAYDAATDRWTPLSLRTAGRRDVAVASDGKALFVTGGSGPIYSSPAPAINPDPTVANFIDAWGVRLAEKITEGSRGVLTAMTRRRAEHASVFSRGTLYVIGGTFQGDSWGYPDHGVAFGSRYFNPTMEAYDADRDSWRVVGTLPTPRAGLAAAVDARGRIYVVGGRGAGGKVVGVVEIFDPSTATWTQGAAMPTPRENFGLAVTDGGIFLAVGGRDAQGRERAVVEAYDPATDTWTGGEEATNPLEEIGFARAEALFVSADATTPPADTLGDFAGRCWEAGRPDEALAGFLMIRRDGAATKIALLKHELVRFRDWFDVLDDQKRATINEFWKAMALRLLPARIVDGALSSVLTPPADGRRSYEYQVKRYADGWLARAVSLQTGTTAITCRLIGKASR